MKEYPIIFSTELIPKILSGSKTQTRRVIKVDSSVWHYIGIDDDGKGNSIYCFDRGTGSDMRDVKRLKCPYGQAGSRLWCRETWATDKLSDYLPPRLLGGAATLPLWYLADSDQHSIIQQGKWRPSIFMPRWASRITLEITEVRVERVTEISEEDAFAEGVDKCEGLRIYPDTKEYEKVNDYRMGFTNLWDSLNAKKYPWSSNPWVWCLSFRRII